MALSYRLTVRLAARPCDQDPAKILWLQWLMGIGRMDRGLRVTCGRTVGLGFRAPLPAGFGRSKHRQRDTFINTYVYAQLNGTPLLTPPLSPLPAAAP